MKILLFNPMINAFYKPMTSPLGLMSIASYLNANGHEAQICDRFFCKDSIKKTLDSHSPDIVGISLITNRFINDAITISKEAKKRKILVVWGGPLATQIPKEILESGYADFISLNEGEETWLEIANTLKSNKELYNIRGLAYYKNNEFFTTGEREFLDISKIPPLDWTLIDVNKYFQPYYQSKKMLYMYSSKGCIGNCTFCYNPRFHHSTHRRRSYDQLFQEIKHLIKNYGMDGVNFADDLMFCNRNQVLDFCNKLMENNISIYWGGNLRADIINNPEDFKLMHKAGCRWLLIGVETGSKEIQKTINKKISFDKIIDTFDNCNNAGIISIAPFMIGLPGETSDDLKSTVDLAKKLKATVCAFNFFTPIPGTKIYNQLIEAGQYHKPESLLSYNDIYFGEKLTTNVSDAHSKDLQVIWGYFQLRPLLFKNNFSDSKKEKRLFVKVLKNALKSIQGRGILNFISSGLIGLIDLTRAFSMFLHPKIRAKYNLYFDK